SIFSLRRASARSCGSRPGAAHRRTSRSGSERPCGADRTLADDEEPRPVGERSIPNTCRRRGETSPGAPGTRGHVLRANRSIGRLGSARLSPDMRSSRSLFVLVLLGAAAAFAASDAELVSDANGTIQTFKQKDSKLEKFFKSASGYAVFPNITKGGFIIGGAAARGGALLRP